MKIHELITRECIITYTSGVFPNYCIFNHAEARAVLRKAVKAKLELDQTLVLSDKQNCKILPILAAIKYEIMPEAYANDGLMHPAFQVLYSDTEGRYPHDPECHPLLKHIQPVRGITTSSIPAAEKSNQWKNQTDLLLDGMVQNGVIKDL